MNNQKRNKTGLLSCVSTLAIIAAPGSLCASSRTARLVVSTALALGVLLPRDAHAASPKTVNPVQSTTYILNPAYNPITFGSGTNISASGEGVLGPNTYTWAVINQGTISGSGTSEGVMLQAGGSVNNQVGGTISGDDGGVYILGGPGTVTNGGTIRGTTTNGGGVWLQDGGTVINTGTIAGASYGVGLHAGGIVTNAGTITGQLVGVDLGSLGSGLGGGTVNNQVGGTIIGRYDGVIAVRGAATVTNAGSITGTMAATLYGVPLGDGVALFAGGVVTNQTGGTISGPRDGVYISGATGSVTNAGAISGGISWWGVQLTGGGSVTNQAGGAINRGVDIEGGIGTLVNAGTISGNLKLLAGGSVTNQAGGVISVGSVKTAVYITGGAGTVTNAGTISSTLATVKFAGPGANTLTLQTGSILTSDAIGSTASGATNALILQGTGVANNNFLNFNSLNVQADVGGVWTLNGVSTVGSTTVASGDLEVGDAAHGTAQLTSSTVTVDAGATLSGHGTVVGSVINQNGATVSPGGSIGTLSIQGDYTQQAGSTLLINVTPTDHSSLAVTGVVHLDGSLSVHLDAATFVGASGTQYNYTDVVSSNQTGGVSGHFANVGFDSSSFFFHVAADYSDGQSVDLQVTRTPFNNNACLNSQNQQSIGSALEAIYQAGGTINPSLLSYLLNIASQTNCASIGGLYDGLGPTQGTVNALVVHSPWQGAVQDRLSASGAPGCMVSGDTWCFGRYAENAAPTVQSDARRQDPFLWLKTGVRDVGSTSVWGRYIGVWGDTNGDSNSSGTNFGVNGAIAGVDHVFSPTFLAGGAAQWTTTNVDFVGSPSDANVDSFEIGGYASYGDTSFYVNGNVSYIWNDFSTSRFIPGPSTAKADYNGRTIAGYAEVGKIFESDGFRLQPLAALSYSTLQSNGYLETGAPGLNLIVDGSNFNSLRSLAGVRIAYPFELDSGRKVVPEFRASWLHEFLDDASTITARLEGTPDLPAFEFNVSGKKISRDTLDLGAGLTAPVSGEATAYIDYDVALNRDQMAQTVSAGLRATW